jgi:hypothetical protein
MDDYITLFIINMPLAGNVFMVNSIIYKGDAGAVLFKLKTLLLGARTLLRPHLYTWTWSVRHKIWVFR